MCTQYFRKIILLFRMLPAPNSSKQLQEELSFILILMVIMNRLARIWHNSFKQYCHNHNWTVWIIELKERIIFAQTLYPKSSLITAHQAFAFFDFINTLIWVNKDLSYFLGIYTSVLLSALSALLQYTCHVQNIVAFSIQQKRVWIPQC